MDTTQLATGLAPVASASYAPAAIAVCAGASHVSADQDVIGRRNNAIQ
jgi:hypothetical protein